MIKFDFWHGESEKDIAAADCFFYPNSGHYAGNIYNKDGKAIGDFTSNDSVEIERRFPGIFGE